MKQLLMIFSLLGISALETAHLSAVYARTESPMEILQKTAENAGISLAEFIKLLNDTQLLSSDGSLSIPKENLYGPMLLHFPLPQTPRKWAARESRN